MRNPLLYIYDIIDCIEKIEIYSKNLTLNEFQKTSETQDAILRRLEIIGEAVKKIPPEIKEKQKEVPWKSIAGLRDVVIHEYFGVNMDRVWKLIHSDLKTFKTEIIKIKDDLENNYPIKFEK